MVMGMLEKISPAALPEPARSEITSSAIDALNREFQGELRQEARHAEVAERTKTLVLQALRGRSLSIPQDEIEAVTADILRRVTGLGFLDLLLPPARTDLSEITIYSHGLIQVMKKDSVRWETIDLKVPAGEVFRVFGMLLGTQSKARSEEH